MMKLLIIWLLNLLLFQYAVAADNAEITSVSELQKIIPGQQHEIQIQVKIPKGFHAYKDQFKILNLQPSTFKAGQLRIKPEIDFYDKFSKKNRQGFKEQGTVSLIIEAAEQVPADLSSMQFDLRYQICSETVCYLPKNLPVLVKIAEASNNAGTIASVQSSEASLSEWFKNSLETNLFLAFLLVFLAGILTSFTPCIFPMLPITISILGYHANKGSRGHNIARLKIIVIKMVELSRGRGSLFTQRLILAITDLYILLTVHLAARRSYKTFTPVAIPQSCFLLRSIIESYLSLTTESTDKSSGRLTPLGTQMIMDISPGAVGFE